MRDALLLSTGRLVCTTPWFIICCVPFYRERRVSLRTMMIAIPVVSVLFFIINLCLHLWIGEYESYSGIASAALYVVVGILFIWGFRAALAKLFYVFLLVQAISTVISYLSAILMKLLYLSGQIASLNTPVYVLVIFMLTMSAAPAVCYFFTHQFQEVMKELGNRDIWMLCIPPALFFVIILIFSNMETNPDFPQEQALVIFLLIAVAGLITYFLNIRLTLDIAHRARLVVDMTAMERQIAMQTQNYQKLAHNIEVARSARHDLHHHLAALASFVEQKDMEGISAYLAQYRQSLPVEHELRVCDNYAVDVVVRYYLQQTKEAGAELDVKIELPADIGIPDTDLTIVFGNLFENAAQGVARQKEGRQFVAARCGIDQGKLILTIDNSTGSESIDSGDMNSKMGIGQTSVKAVADKYQGGVRFERMPDGYRAAVLLTIPDFDIK